MTQREADDVVRELRISRAEGFLEQIVEHETLCIFNHDPAFREGSAAAFSQMAELAKQALKVLRE